MHCTYILKLYFFIFILYLDVKLMPNYLVQLLLALTNHPETLIITGPGLS